MKNPKIKNYQKGVSLIITFFIMVILLAIVLAVSALLYSEIKVVKNIGNSVAAFYSADSGIEKVLYYDRKVVPDNAKRGLCTMYPYNPANNPDACPAASEILGYDSSVYCNPNVDFALPVVIDPVNYPNGCEPEACNSCEISFSTTFDNRKYDVTAKVLPSADEQFSDLSIKSKGFFMSTGREIETLIRKEERQGAIKIENACANPKSNPQGETIDIFADISTLTARGTISRAEATIYDSSGRIAGSILLSLASGTYVSGSWQASWSTNKVDTYYVSLDVKDTLDPPNEQILNNILPCNFYP